MKHKQFHKLLSAVCAFVLLLTLVPAGYAADSPTVSTNINNQDYWTLFAKKTVSYLYENPSGGLTRVEYIAGSAESRKDSGGNAYWAYPNGKIIVEDYDSTFRFQTGRTVPMELTYWGGFFAGEDYNYILFGDPNYVQSDSAEVVRVVKYSKDWQRLGQASISAINTVLPFANGGASFAEAGGYLYIHTNHDMYKDRSGYVHEACMMLQIRESDMTLIDSQHAVSNPAYDGYVSHSFNQFILIDQDQNVVTWDQGDGYPRSAILYRYNVKAGPEKLFDTPIPKAASSSVQAFATYPGADTLTGAALGGFAETANGYVSAYNYDGQAKTGDRSVYLGYTTKSGLASTTKKLSSAGTTAPLLAPMGLSGGYIMWNEQTSTKNSYGFNDHTITDRLCYASYSDGGSVGTVQTATGALSDCQPIAYNGKAVWYVTNNSAPVFYGLDANGVTVLGGGAQTPAPEPVKPSEQTPSTGPAKPDSQPGSAQQPDQTTRPDGTGAQYGAEVIRLMNEARRDAGLKELKELEILDRAAQIRASELVTATQNDRPDGRKYDTVLTDLNVSNIGWRGDLYAWSPNDLTPEALLDLWRKEPSQMKVILNANFDHVGFSTAHSSSGMDYYYLFFGEVKSEQTPDTTTPTTTTPSTPSTTTTPTTTTTTTTTTRKNPFTDVPNSAYYTDAVLWALDAGITTGTSATTFEPYTTCTRGQVVTFLWRAKGCPEPKTKTNPFRDVKSSSPYFKAILWAYENDITTGTSANTFSPNGTCTNGHVVTFLWRAEGQPAASGSSSMAQRYPGKYYTGAVAWADTYGLLADTGTAFDPASQSPRANIVTYLYRDLAE